MINVPGVQTTAFKRNSHRHGHRAKHEGKKFTPKKQYVNPNEVEKGIELIAKLNHSSDISSILVITPVSHDAFGIL